MKFRELSLRNGLKSAQAKNDPTRALPLIRGMEKEVSALFPPLQRSLIELIHSRQLEAARPINPKDVGKDVGITVDEKYKKPASKIVKKTIPKAYKKGTGFINAAIGGKLGERQENLKRINAFIESADAYFQGLGDETAKKVTGAITQHIISGGTLGSLEYEIEDILGVSQSGAMTIIRTEIIRAVNGGLVDEAKKNNVEKMEWLTVLDDKQCDECEEMDGKEFPIDNLPDNPLHPNCRCSWLPVISLPEGDWYE